MSQQPPGTPPREWKPRVDGSTEHLREVRLLREEVSGLSSKVGKLDAQLVLNHETMKTEMGHLVSYKALITFLLAALVADGALMAWYGMQVNAVVKALQESNTQSQKAQTERVEKVEGEWSWLKKKADGSEWLQQHGESDEKDKRKRR